MEVFHLCHIPIAFLELSVIRALNKFFAMNSRSLLFSPFFYIYYRVLFKFVNFLLALDSLDSRYLRRV